MMTNLFSNFDPSSSIISIQMNWLSMTLILLIIPMKIWLTPSQQLTVWNKILLLINQELKTIMIPKKSMGLQIIMLSMFSMITLNNSMGLLPYIFTSTSHILFNLSLALPLWMTLMLYGWMNFTNHMFTHMVPQSTPPILMPFMVMIETISNIIRPWTLAIRLTANMIAGHLLMTLLGSSGSNCNISKTLITINIQFLLITLELAVALIQAYVFTVLSSLYSSEIN
uniref:ATP synthase subunit a n=1 Tax=Nocticola sp. JW1 9/1 TaxID=2093475 RepID=A0A2P1H9H2_9NEOP|nr:ATP synthase F0 subunit 6 [Nocticola sp. JW1 9/1]